MCKLLHKGAKFISKRRPKDSILNFEDPEMLLKDFVWEMSFHILKFKTRNSSKEFTQNNIFVSLMNLKWFLLQPSLKKITKTRNTKWMHEKYGPFDPNESYNRAKHTAALIRGHRRLIQLLSKRYKILRPEEMTNFNEYISRTLDYVEDPVLKLENEDRYAKRFTDYTDDAFHFLTNELPYNIVPKLLRAFENDLKNNFNIQPVRSFNLLLKKQAKFFRKPRLFFLNGKSYKKSNYESSTVSISLEEWNEYRNIKHDWKTFNNSEKSIKSKIKRRSQKTAKSNEVPSLAEGHRPVLLRK